MFCCLKKGHNNKIEFKEEVEDDPQRRRPDISVAKEHLDWEPKVTLKSRLEKTVDYFRKELKRNRLIENHLESKLHNMELFSNQKHELTEATENDQCKKIEL